MVRFLAVLPPIAHFDRRPRVDLGDVEYCVRRGEEQ
jgi:hypothetical protein